MLFVEPILNSGGVAHDIVWSVVSVVDHVLCEELPHDLHLVIEIMLLLLLLLIIMMMIINHVLHEELGQEDDTDKGEVAC